VNAPYLVIVGTIAVMSLMAALWVLHFRLRNAGIVDVGWAAGLAFLGVFYAIQGDGHQSHRILVAFMSAVWGGRLALHLLFDRVIGRPEDGRYATLRNDWGASWPVKSFFFFQFQALLDVLLSLPFLWMALNPNPGLNGWEMAGLLLWIVALTGESLADAQLKRFKASLANKGKTCRVGLWNYSRHPNYFFEWLIWVAFFVAAMGSPWGWTSILCPVLMLYFLLRVTGIPMTEQQALKSRGDDYRDYQRTTSMFVPWFPKKRGLTS